MYVNSSISCQVFFFFQAEDGIRDIGVTGVQTCALPILAAVYKKHSKNCYVILLSPQGKRFTQKDVKRLIQTSKNLVFICGHYEGIDERIFSYIDEQISAGDFITSGGEMPALLITDALIRALPGFIAPEVYQI